MNDNAYTTADIAKHFNVKQDTVRKWIVDGCPCERNGRGKPTKFNLAKVKNWRSDSSSSGARLDPQREKAMLDRERRLKVATERKVLEGKLIPATDVVEHWGQLVASARAKFLNFPQKIAPAVVSCETIGDIEDEARRLVYEALEELAGTGIPDQHVMEATPEADGESVGGSVSKAKS